VPPQTFTFYRPARAHPRPPPGDEVVVAAPPAPPATPGTGWLSQLLPLAGTPHANACSDKINA
jgi:hypothetical protein